MARPRSDQPTPAELEVLKVLWDAGPCTVRQVMARLAHDSAARKTPRAYTTVMTLMNVMHDKALLKREPRGKAFVYRPTARQEKTLKAMIGDIVDRAFQGSASTLVAHLLDQADPSAAELQEIRRLIAQHKRQQKGGR